MKLIRLNQWISKDKTQPILINTDLIQSVALAKHDEPVPILNQENTTWLTHVVMRGGTHGFLVTEAFDEITKLVNPL